MVFPFSKGLADRERVIAAPHRKVQRRQRSYFTNNLCVIRFVKRNPIVSAIDIDF